MNTKAQKADSLGISGSRNFFSDNDETSLFEFETETAQEETESETETGDETESETGQDETQEAETVQSSCASGQHVLAKTGEKEASCTENGYTEYTCQVCSEVFETDIVQAYGHDYEAAAESSEDEDGYISITYECTRCGDTYVETEQYEAASESGSGLSEILAHGIYGYAAFFAAGVILTAVIFCIFIKKRRKKKSRKEEALKKEGAYIGSTLQPDEGLNIVVGKLHAQGARENQQDSFAVSPPEMVKTHGIFAVVADGMGGLSGGEKVSQTVVCAMMDAFVGESGDPDKILLHLLQKANSSVNAMLGTEGLGRSGSTVVAAIVKDGLFHFISVGDSRIALLRDNVLYQLNREHIYCNDLAVEAVNGSGTLAAAFAHPKAHGLTSFLGMGRLKHIDIPARALSLKAGDRFVLMSDGVYNALSDAEIISALRLPPAESAGYLGEMIRQKNYPTQDNYTAVILTVEV